MCLTICPGKWKKSTAEHTIPLQMSQPKDHGCLQYIQHVQHNLSRCVPTDETGVVEQLLCFGMVIPQPGKSLQVTCIVEANDETLGHRVVLEQLDEVVVHLQQHGPQSL